ncbi:MAG: MotA/TolQ/ExbB proton channel family protein, partial [Candidatus Omnitrophica bacterium]|nr:MotA/TolQ/ExbB proton channel family protein [Candidatus Omnitrophota bacterium]
ALLTTVAGLLVAIPAFVVYNYLVSRVNSFLLEMEKASTELVNFLAE